MRALPILLSLLLLALPAVAAEPDAIVYDLQAVVHADSVEVRVHLAATIDQLPAKWELELSSHMKILTLTVNDVAVPRERKGDRLVLSLGVLPKQTPGLLLKAEVAGSPVGGGGGRESTLISPGHARIRSQNPWYPRAPSDAAMYLTVVKTRKDWSVRTAGAEKSIETEGDLRVWTYEQGTPVRGIGLIAGPYQVTKFDAGGGFVLDAWTLPGDEAAANGILGVAKDAFDRYRAWFGKVDVERFSVLEMPAAYGSMSGYGESGYVLLGKGAFERGSGSASTVSLVAHEVAHTWWGQEVGFAHFASESLASWATLRYLAAASGEEAARAERERGIRAVLDTARDDGQIALSEIRNFGSGLPYPVYRAHAYEKGMMILSMVEDILGTRRMNKLLSGFIADHRGAVTEWADLREALAKGGSRTKTALDQWERTGLPTLTVEHTVKQWGKRCKVIGRITQSGTTRPYHLRVPVVAVCGAKRFVEQVTLDRGETRFTMTTPTPPEAILLDPDWRLLVHAPRGSLSVDDAWDRAYDVVLSPELRDPARCEEAIILLRQVLESGAGKRESLCWSGIGRCQFRLGLFEEAKVSLKKALKIGIGPHHRGWIHLRLGNIADASGQRKEALGYYEAVATPNSGASKGARIRAEKYVDSPYHP